MTFDKENVQTIEKLKNGDTSVSPLYSRRLTWCDLIFMACVECSKDKYALLLYIIQYHSFSILYPPL